MADDCWDFYTRWWPRKKAPFAPHFSIKRWEAWFPSGPSPGLLIGHEVRDCLPLYRQAFSQLRLGCWSSSVIADWNSLAQPLGTDFVVLGQYFMTLSSGLSHLDLTVTQLYQFLTVILTRQNEFNVIIPCVTIFSRLVVNLLFCLHPLWWLN